MICKQQQQQHNLNNQQQRQERQQQCSHYLLIFCLSFIQLFVLAKTTTTWSFTISAPIVYHKQSQQQRQQQQQHLQSITKSSRRLYGTSKTTTDKTNDDDAIAFVSSTIADNSISNMSKKPKKGDVVTIECKLVPNFDIISLDNILMDGVVVVQDDINSEQQMVTTKLQFVIGMGNYIESLHEVVQTVTIDETITNQCIDAGYGIIDERAIATIKYSDIPGITKEQLRIGTVLSVPSAPGSQFRVTTICDETITINGNHPNAGQTYNATITLHSIESGPTPIPYNNNNADSSNDNTNNNSIYNVATFALGCFWGGELEYMRIPGVISTAVGYTQGIVNNPSYEQVCTGTTGHTEAILVYYDPLIVSYSKLIELFFIRLGSTNKKLLNQVGNDRGTQYRHGIYYHTKEQEIIAKELLVKLGGEECVTECKPATSFFFAENYHQQYLYKNGQSARKNDISIIRCYG